MTSRERVRAAFAHSPPDRTPIFEYVLLPPVAEAVLGRRFLDYHAGMEAWTAMAGETGFEPALRRYVAARLDTAERLGHDLLYVSPNPVPGAQAAQPGARELQFHVAALGNLRDVRSHRRRPGGEHFRHGNVDEHRHNAWRFGFRCYGVKKQLFNRVGRSAA